MCTSPRCSTGVVLTRTVLKFAQELKGTTRHIHVISLSCGQAAKAEDQGPGQHCAVGLPPELPSRSVLYAHALCYQRIVRALCVCRGWD